LLFVVKFKVVSGSPSHLISTVVIASATRACIQNVWAFILCSSVHKTLVAAVATRPPTKASRDAKSTTLLVFMTVLSRYPELSGSFPERSDEVQTK